MRAFIWASFQVSLTIVSDSLRPCGLQHTRLPCPSPTLRAYSNPCPLSWWCHPTISSSVVPFSSRLESFPASGSFPMSQFFTSKASILRYSVFFMHFGELKLVWFLRVAGSYSVSGIWLRKDSLFSSQFIQVTTEGGRVTSWSFQPTFWSWPAPAKSFISSLAQVLPVGHSPVSAPPSHLCPWGGFLPPECSPSTLTVILQLVFLLQSLSGDPSTTLSSSVSLLCWVCTLTRCALLYDACSGWFSAPVLNLSSLRQHLDVALCGSLCLSQ